MSLGDAELAARLAGDAGRLLTTLRAGGYVAGKDLGALGDDVSNRFLMAALRAQRPADGLLSEESRCDGARLAKSRVWIIDPLDGTREFSEGRDDWAVHVALSVDGEATVGAVALPGLGLTFRSDQPCPPPPCGAPLRLVVSRTRPAAEAVAVAETLGAVLVPMGSAGAKAMAILRGEADVYLHSGGQYEWDSCAPVAVAAASGLHCSRIDGSPLVYNRENVYLPDLLICRREQAARILALVGEWRRSSGASSPPPVD
jgi:3'(2'), 5'-bisphosphate nucleotidase